MKRTFHLLYYKTYGLSICLFLVVKSKGSNSLREKCPNTEFFLVRILLYLEKIQENTDQKKLRIWTLFTKWFLKKFQTLNCFEKIFYVNPFTRRKKVKKYSLSFIAFFLCRRTLLCQNKFVLFKICLFSEYGHSLWFWFIVET